MSKTKKQHFVPQFYLRNFSNDGKRIFAFDKRTKNSFATNVEDIGFQKYFYNTPLEVISGAEENFQQAVASGNSEELLKFVLQGDETPEEIENLRIMVQQPGYVEAALKHFRDEEQIEKTLANFEGGAAPIFDKLINDIDKYQVIKRKDKADLAFAMAVQLLRLPSRRNEIAQIGNHALQILSKDIAEKEGFDVSDVKFSSEYNTYIHLGMLTDINTVDTIASIFEQHIWILGFNNTDTLLYTSDAPIVRKGHLRLVRY